MKELSDFSMEKEIARIHQLCDDAGVPRDISPAGRVQYYMRRAEKWLEFLEFLGCDTSQGSTHEEKESLVDSVAYFVGVGVDCGGNDSISDMGGGHIE